MLLTFIRHGKSEAAEKNLSQSAETPLSSHAIQVITEKAKTFENRKYDYVYTSTYARAQQTAEILFGKGMYRVLDYIHESRLSPHLHGKSKQEVNEYWITLPAHIRHDPEYKHTNGMIIGESFNEFCERVNNFIDFLIKDHGDTDHIALVGHGMFFQVFLAILMKSTGFNFQTYSDFFRYLKLENVCEVTVEIDVINRSGVIREMRNWKKM